MSIPTFLISLLSPFVHQFSAPVFKKIQLMCVGAILCQGARTVASILRISGLAHEQRFEQFHRVLNRDRWNIVKLSRILLGCLVAILPGVAIEIVADETLERRNGPKINAKGCYRDAVRSSEKHLATCFGLKWLSLCLLVKLPWAARPWALPFMTILIYSKKHDEDQNRTHQTGIHRLRKAVHIISRWLKKKPWILVGDGGFANMNLINTCMQYGVTLVSRLRLDARLFKVPKQKQPGTKGRPAQKGARIMTFKAMMENKFLFWRKVAVTWYAGTQKTLEILTGISLLYKAGNGTQPVRWVLVRDPEGRHSPMPLFSTDLNMLPQTIIETFVRRFSIETTFEEAHAHLGFETQRQWSDKAIARSTPLIMGMFSFICLAALKLREGMALTVRSAAWYTKAPNNATFSDIIAFVRRCIWSERILVNSAKKDEMTKLQPDFLESMLELVAYSP
jgi:hypothetical protein